MREDNLISYANAILELYTPHSAEVARYDLKYNVYERKVQELHSSIMEFITNINTDTKKQVANDTVRKLKEAYKSFRK